MHRVDAIDCRCAGLGAVHCWKFKLWTVFIEHTALPATKNTESESKIVKLRLNYLSASLFGRLHHRKSNVRGSRFPEVYFVSNGPPFARPVWGSESPVCRHRGRSSMVQDRLLSKAIFSENSTRYFCMNFIPWSFWRSVFEHSQPNVWRRSHQCIWWSQEDLQIL